MSTTTRLLLAFLLLLGIGVFFFQKKLTERVKRQYLEAAEEPLVDTAQIFAALIEQHVDAGGTFDLGTIRHAFAAARQRKFTAQIYNLTKTTLTTHTYVTDRNGLVLFDSDGGRTEGQNYSRFRDVALTLAGRYGARSTQSDPNDPGSSVMFVAAPIRHGGEIIGVVSVAKPHRSMFSFIVETQRWIHWAALIFLVAVVLGAVLLTNLFSRPIHRLTAYARAVARGERVPLPKLGPPEVGTLGRAFEEMRDALEGRKYVETFLQTLMHELKSPVAAIRGAAELLREEMPAERREKFLANIQTEARRLQNISDRLLALSAIESRKALEHPEAILLAELVTTVCAQMQPAAEARGATLSSETCPDAIVCGERFLLEMALANLVQNAIEFSPPGAAVRIRAGAEGDHAQIVVEDEGVGIPEYALGRVFERFYSLPRPDSGAKSSGLGLCFVQEAAHLHGGEACVVNRSDRPGVCATIRLPRMPGAA